MARSSMPGTGGINIAFDCRHVLHTLDKMAKNAPIVEERTLKDLKQFIPGCVSGAVSQVYQIQKSEVAATRRSSNVSRGRNAGKSSVSTSFSGNTIASLSVEFKGKKKANYPTKTKQKSRKTSRNGIKPYSVFVTTMRGNPVEISASHGLRVFVRPKNGQLRVFKVGADNNPKVHASTSVPQAILNEKSARKWKLGINRKLRIRFTYQLSRLYPELKPAYNKLKERNVRIRQARKSKR